MIFCCPCSSSNAWVGGLFLRNPSRPFALTWDRKWRHRGRFAFSTWMGLHEFTSPHWLWWPCWERLGKVMTMEMRTFGRSGMPISLLGFGCGAVGGLMVRGAPNDQERTIARAMEAGVI